MSSFPDRLDSAAIAALLPTSVRQRFDVRVVERTGSTNSDLLRDVASLPSGTVLAAEAQTAGRGRRGRAWIAPPGGSLAFSVLWKFDGNVAALSGLSLAVGVAVARALEASAAEGVRLKWPNDLLAQRDGQWCKLGGILIELSSATAGTVAAVIGIGLNVNLGVAASTIDQPVTDVRALKCDATRDALLAAILVELVSVLSAFAIEGFAPLADEWNQRHAWCGLPVSLADDHGSSGDAAGIAGGIAGAVARGVASAVNSGVASGVAEDGALLIDTPAGQRRVVSGDVSLRLAPVALNRS